MKIKVSRNPECRLAISLGLTQSALTSAYSQEEIQNLTLQARPQVFGCAQARDELDTLNRLTAYVDRLIERLSTRTLADSVFNSDTVPVHDNTSDRLSVLAELKVYAFGKTVILDDLNGSIKVYRIAQANEGYIDGADVVINRLAPVARKLVPATVDDIVDLPDGDYRVVAVSLLSRYSLALRADNFQQMLYRDVELGDERVQIDDLLVSLKSWPDRIRRFLDDKASHAGASLAQPETAREDAYFQEGSNASLGTRFYTDTTQDQERVISDSPAGLVIVRGVAGSGKTSVALGRTKALCDRRFAAKDSDDWDDFFSPETSVGFVLNNQLIEYLKRTRDQLNMHAMPIWEYDQLRQDLLRRRTSLLGIRLSMNGAGEFAKARTETALPLDGRMRLLNVADRAVAKGLAMRLRQHLEKLADPSSGLHSSSFFSQIWGEFADAARSLAGDLERDRRDGGFACSNLAERLRAVHGLISAALERQWLSVPVNGRWIHPERPAEAIKQLAEFGYEFGYYPHLNNKEKVIKRATDEQVGQLYENRDVLFADNMLKESLAAASQAVIKKNLEDGTLYEQIQGRASRVDWEQFRIEREFRDQRLWVRQRDNETAKWIKVRMGKVSREGKSAAGVRKVQESAKQVLFGSVCLPRLMRECLERSAIDGFLEVQDRSTLSALNRRLSDHKLIESDIDLFLALAQVITTGYKGDLPQFEAAPTFSTVFIDEVQDFSELQLFLMGSQADPRRRAVTIVGDSCQQLSYDAEQDWRRCFPAVPDGQVKEVGLDRNKRQEEAPALATFTQWFRHAVLGDSLVAAPDAQPREVEGELSVCIASSDQTAEIIENRLNGIPGNASVAVVCPDEARARSLEMKLHDTVEAIFRKSAYSSDHRDLNKPYYVHFTTPLATKGLEFDAVIATDFEQYDFSDRLQANSAYVAISRARSSLTIISETSVLPTGSAARSSHRLSQGNTSGEIWVGELQDDGFVVFDPRQQKPNDRERVVLWSAKDRTFDSYYKDMVREYLRSVTDARVRMSVLNRYREFCANEVREFG